MLDRLPEELRSQILAHCDSSSVLSVCLASKALCHACIIHLYRNIDLASHDTETWKPHNVYSNVEVPADHVRASLTEEDCSLIARQSRLIALLVQRPELGREAREVRWTMMKPPVQTAGGNDHDAFNLGSEELWRTFACFSKVTTMDLAFQTTFRELAAPPLLFPLATSISLSGVASYAVLSAIFDAIDPCKLRHLRLNNLQTFADTGTLLLSQAEVIVHRRERAGGAYGWLNRLRGNCPNLRSFHYLTTAIFVDRSRDVLNTEWPQQVLDERNRYTELGHFIASIKHHIHELVFEHGPDIDFFGYNPGRHSLRAFRGPSRDDPLPMDIFFDAYISPVLSSGPWPELEKLVIRGIGHWKPLDFWSKSTKPEEFAYLHRKTVAFRDHAQSIWETVGGNKIDICIEAVASKPFYRFVDDRWARA